MKKLLTVLTLLIAAAAGVFFSVDIEPETDHLQLLAGDVLAEYPPCRATFFGRDIHDRLAVTDNIDYYHAGEYSIDYSFRFIPPLRKTVHVPVTVLDVDSPVISMPEGSVYFIRTHDEFVLPEFTIEDSYDASEDITVEVLGEVDTDTAGEYKLQIKACDVSGNCSVKSVAVEVGEMREEDFLPANFHLYNYDTGHVILGINEEYISDEEYSQIWLVGDSNYLNLAKEGGYPADRVIGRFALSPNSADLPVTYNNEQTDKTLLELLADLQPRCILMDIGLTQSGAGNPIQLKKQYGQLIREIREVTPDTIIYVSSLFPVSAAENEVHVSQAQVNKTNYYLLKLCEEEGLSMFDVPSYLYGEDGCADMEFFRADGYHLAGMYYDLFTDHIRSYLKVEGVK